MSPPRNTPNIGPNNLANEEARMRQALGLRNGPGGGQVPQRREGEQRGRRFVKDGEVPVVVVNSGSRDGGIEGAVPVSRVAAAEASARSERNARELAERALAEAQSVVQHLRTQLAHADMAHREALNAERSARQKAESALREAIEARSAAETRVAELATALRQRRPRPEIVPSSERPTADFAKPDSDIPRRPRGRPRKVVAPVTEAEEQEPVQWWLPSFRASSSSNSKRRP
jgi:hypothetical protein